MSRWFKNAPFHSIVKVLSNFGHREQLSTTFLEIMSRLLISQPTPLSGPITANFDCQKQCWTCFKSFALQSTQLGMKGVSLSEKSFVLCGEFLSKSIFKGRCILLFSIYSNRYFLKITFFSTLLCAGWLRRPLKKRLMKQIKIFLVSFTWVAPQLSTCCRMKHILDKAKCVSRDSFQNKAQNILLYFLACDWDCKLASLWSWAE